MSSLACRIAFCKVTSRSCVSISCFGPCHGKFHAICLGIPEVCIEMFRDPFSGFKYICSVCRDISIASISNDFKQMEMEFKTLKSKLLRFEMSSSEVRNDANNNSAKIDSTGKRSVNEIDELTVPVSKKVSAVSSYTTVSEVALTDISVDPLLLPSLELAAATSLLSNAAPPLETPVFLPQPTAPNSMHVVELNVVPKPMSVFVSRLDPVTTTEQISDYIRFKLGNCDIIKVKKLTNNSKPVSSFRIDVNRDLVDSLLLKEIWPDGTFVDVFKIRSNKNQKKRLNNRSNPTNRIINNNTSSTVSNSKN